MAETRNRITQTPEIGERLKFFRKGQGLSIRVLAEKAGLSPNTISLIETNASSPTVATLQTLANVLEIPLSAFFTRKDEEEDVIFVETPERVVTPGLTVRVFPGQVLDQRVQVMHFRIAPGASSGSQPLVHPGDELVMCLEGELEYTVKDRIYRLREQDSLAFKAQIPHSWFNRSQADADILVMITTEPDQSFRTHIQP